MASDSSDHRPDGELAAMTPAEARAALGDLEHDGATLAARIVTPPWYHPALGVITAVLVGAHALPGAWPLIAIALGVAAIPALTTAYARRYGVAISKPTGPRSRRLLLVVLAVLVTATVSTLALKLLELAPWWALVPAAIAFIATVVLGRRYDDALRQEVAAPGGARP